MKYGITGKQGQTLKAILCVKVFADGPDKNDCGNLHPEAMKLFKSGALPSEPGRKTVHVIGGKKILFLGAGALKDYTKEKAREINARFVREAKAMNETGLVINPALHAKASAEGAFLASYVFDMFKTKKDTGSIEIFFAGADKTKSAEIRDAAILCGNVFLARDLANTPSNVATPEYVASFAEEKLKGLKNLKVTVRDEKWIKKQGMNAFYAVSKGSGVPPRFVEIEYRGAKGNKHAAIIGKGITFDSGGISIKPQSTPLGGIEEMKFDMSGAAAVFAMIRTVAQLGVKVNLNVYMPLTDNMPDGNAYKPGDIIETMAGITVEVISTDAEGRLILCDAIEYARRKKPEYIADIATLTGACSVTFGGITSGVMGNDRMLVANMKKAGDETGELVWELPLHEQYYEWIKGKYADIRNTGTVPKAGTITAGMFLKEFVKDTPWVHVDIAGTAYGITHKPYIPDTGSGMGARLLFDFVKKQEGLE